jgi:hypothetical protein
LHLKEATLALRLHLIEDTANRPEQFSWGDLWQPPYLSTGCSHTGRLAKDLLDLKEGALRASTAGLEAINRFLERAEAEAAHKQGLHHPGTITYGRIISLSSCSSMWQCHT